MKELLDKILKDCTPYIEQGKLASYIPELAKADKNEFGICVVSDKNRMEFSGDYDKGFTMQSVAKPMILLMALSDNGAERVRNLEGVESTRRR